MRMSPLALATAGSVWLSLCGPVVAECAVRCQASPRLSFDDRLAAKTDAVAKMVALGLDYVPTNVTVPR